MEIWSHGHTFTHSSKMAVSFACPKSSSGNMVLIGFPVAGSIFCPEWV